MLLVPTRRGLVRAERVGERWEAQRTLEPGRTRCVAADRAAGLTYCGTQGGGVLRSEDRGRTWTPSGLPGAVVTALAVSPSEAGVVYAGTKPAYVYVSRDGGATWRELERFRRIRSRWYWMSPAERPFIAYVMGLAVSPADPGVVLAGVEAGAVVRSEDGGRSWSGHRRRASIDCHSLTFHARHGEWAYEGGGTGPAVSRDGGRTWSRPTRGLDRRYCWAVAADPAAPELWYVSASPGPRQAHGDDAQAHIFRSLPGGAWRRLGGGLPEPLTSMPYGLAAPAPGELYAALADGAVWHSADAGDTWNRLPVNLGPNQGLCLAQV